MRGNQGRQDHDHVDALAAGDRGGAMSWDERPYAEDSYDPGRGSRFSDNPMGWSFSIGRVSGIDIRIHFIFVLYVGMELLLAALSNPKELTDSVLFKARTMGLLFAAVFLHELGHCFA